MGHGNQIGNFWQEEIWAMLGTFVPCRKLLAEGEFWNPASSYFYSVQVIRGTAHAFGETWGSDGG